jgi:hypothetical protein
LPEKLAPKLLVPAKQKMPGGWEMQSLSQDHSPTPLAQKAGPILPRTDAPEILFGGFVFTAGDPPPSAGLFALTRRIGDFLNPLLIGEADKMAAAAAAAIFKVEHMSVCFQAALFPPKTPAREQ